MPLIYNIDVLNALKYRGYSTYRIRREKLLGESTLQKLRLCLPISWENIETICILLHCQPGDIIRYEESDNTENDGGN